MVSDCIGVMSGSVIVVVPVVVVNYYCIPISSSIIWAIVIMITMVNPKGDHSHRPEIGWIIAIIIGWIIGYING